LSYGSILHLVRKVGPQFVRNGSDGRFAVLSSVDHAVQNLRFPQESEDVQPAWDRGGKTLGATKCSGQKYFSGLVLYVIGCVLYDTDW
jgi:hypothetical protein